MNSRYLLEPFWTIHGKRQAFCVSVTLVIYVEFWLIRSGYNRHECGIRAINKMMFISLLFWHSWGIIPSNFKYLFSMSSSFSYLNCSSNRSGGRYLFNNCYILVKTLFTLIVTMTVMTYDGIICRTLCWKFNVSKVMSDSFYSLSILY